MLSAFRQEEQKNKFPYRYHTKTKKIMFERVSESEFYAQCAKRENFLALSHIAKKNIYDKYIFYSRIFTFSFSPPLLFVAWRHKKKVGSDLIEKNIFHEKAPPNILDGEWIIKRKERDWLDIIYNKRLFFKRLKKYPSSR